MTHAASIHKAPPELIPVPKTVTPTGWQNELSRNKLLFDGNRLLHFSLNIHTVK